MSFFKLLIVEDNDRDIQTCKSTITRYIAERQCKIEPEYCKDMKTALSTISREFDGAIIDLRLDNSDKYVGNDLVQIIRNQYRIPISILTGTPGQYYDGEDSSLIKAYKKGETGYDEILDSLFKVYNTGLTKILGGRGKIEQCMTDVFWKNILPQLTSWVRYSSAGKNTESALLRLTLSHLMDILDEDSDSYFSEEMYITPPLTARHKTGSIVKKSNSDYYIVLSPACDMAIRNGQLKTDRILLCLIEGWGRGKSIIKNANHQNEGKKTKAIGQIESIISNRCALYYHFLPKTEQFEGGVVNFRKVETYTVADFFKLFGATKVQLTPPFTKDIVSRFSSYYARQGQPDLDFSGLRDDIVSDT